MATKKSVKSLDREIERLKALREKLAARDKTPAIRQITALMKKSGVTLDDLKGAAGKPAKAAGRSARKSASKGTTVPPKYRNPATGDTWTGRGRTPVWMAEAERAGATRASFLIAPAS